LPTPSDLIKTAANKSGVIVPYMHAYRFLTDDILVGNRFNFKTFEQVTPYIEEMQPTVCWRMHQEPDERNN
jgi:hypothetical protein